MGTHPRFPCHAAADCPGIACYGPGGVLCAVHHDALDVECTADGCTRLTHFGVCESCRRKAMGPLRYARPEELTERERRLHNVSTWDERWRDPKEVLGQRTVL